MRTIYLDCEKGAAGDMICAALFGLVSDRDSMLRRLNGTGLEGVWFLPEQKGKYGIEGYTMTVSIHGHEEGEANRHEDIQEQHHHHMTMEEIGHIVSLMDVSDQVKASVMEIYQIIAQAESKAHGCPVSEVHFHEVGALDAIADVTAACLLFEELAPDRILASRLCVGSGTVSCAHGVLPVPAPATANILQDIPYTAGDIDGEICTPTGAAILRYFAREFSAAMPGGCEKTGVGFGKKVFNKPSYFAAAMS